VTAPRDYDAIADMQRDNETLRARVRELERDLEKRGSRCERCKGTARLLYGNTSTWRHSMGGASITEGICEACWGTGRSDITGPDLRAIDAHEAQLEREVSERWLAWRLGASFSSVRPHLATIAARIKHKRADDFWLQRCTETVRSVLEHLSKEPEKGSGT